ncbi:MAG: hypothetical protein LBU17_01555 [Treponema sp.]|jgi:hypothetical protein|nr:hypothetical protein [Treponema sp.]
MLFSYEFTNLLVQILSSWEVIAVTLVLVVYYSLVSYVVRGHRRPSAPVVPKTPRPKRIPKEKKAPPKPADEDEDLEMQEA